MSWIMAAVFAAGAMISAISNSVNNYNQGQDEIRRREAKRDRELSLMQLRFESEKRAAFKKADAEDRITTLAEATLGNQTNQALATLGFQHEADVLRYNQMAIQNGINTGQANASMAVSGTRNSSSMAAIEMQGDLAENQLQHQEDMDRRGSELTLEAAVNNIAEGSENLQTRRNQAQEIRDTFAPGGDQYQLYEKQRNNYTADVLDNTNQIGEATAIGWDDWTNILVTAPIQGGTKGYQFGSQIKNYWNDWTNFDKKDPYGGPVSFDNVGQQNYYG